MAEKSIRIGMVSKVNYASGMIEVTYPDMDDTVTDELPVCSFNDEYKMPDIGREVLVLHLSNGSAAGVVMGPYWNGGNRPTASGKGVYRKEMGPEPGKAYTQYRDETLTIKAPSVRLACDAGRTMEFDASAIQFVCDEGTVTAARIIQAVERIENM